MQAEKCIVLESLNILLLH